MNEARTASLRCCTGLIHDAPFPDAQLIALRNAYSCLRCFRPTKNKMNNMTARPIARPGGNKKELTPIIIRYLDE
jgi:hypothetical protein